MIKVNEYFEGSVKSLAVVNKDGNATVGVIAPGSFKFGTGTIEIMHVISGSMEVKLPESSKWNMQPKGTQFRVEKGVEFEVKCTEPVAYLCYYL